MNFLSHGKSHRIPLSFCARGALGVLLLFSLSACARVPITGRSQLLLTSEAYEIQLGEQTFTQVKQKQRISHDPQRNAMLQRVGRRIAAASGKGRFYRWEFIVIQNKAPNAFALPGGKVAVNTGMFTLARDEMGLATVVGHEVAHVIARHGGERLSQRLIVNIGLQAVQIGMRRQDPFIVRQVAGLLGAGANVGILLPFSRTHESEADRLGLTYMAKAGYDPRAAVGFWQRMAAAARGRGGRPPEFLSTHPSGSRRIRQIRGWLPEALRHYRPRR